MSRKTFFMLKWLVAGGKSKEEDVKPGLPPKPKFTPPAPAKVGPQILLLNVALTKAEVCSCPILNVQTLFQLTSKKGLKQFKLAAVTKPLDTSQVEKMALEAIKRILSAESKCLRLVAFLPDMDKFLFPFRCRIKFYLVSAEAAQLGNVKEVRVKIIAALVCQFGGPLRKGELICIPKGIFGVLPKVDLGTGTLTSPASL